MAGIYIHIPFCKQACHYCDFHFSTNISYKNEMVDAICNEIGSRHDFLSDLRIQTIYFGGGTPSLLLPEQISKILRAIYQHFDIAQDTEITLECNPDDINSQLLRKWQEMGANRLSIGIQSFRDRDLKLMNRAHCTSEGRAAVICAKDVGFDNISLDLIYGIPGLDEIAWKDNLLQATSLGIQHISAYCLTLEPKTVFAHWTKTGKLPPLSSSQGAQQFEILVKHLQKYGMMQYEVSNFSIPGFESRHNSAYWQGEEYLGVGPSAHSFNGKIRYWNQSNNPLYIKAMKESHSLGEEEVLTKEMRFNEWVMTGLRTKKGVSIKALKSTTGYDVYLANQEYIDTLMAEGKAEIKGGNIRLTTDGLLYADHIASELFVVD